VFINLHVPACAESIHFLNPISNLRLDLFTLTVGLGGIVSVVDNEILWVVVVLAAEVALEDGLGAVGVSLLGIEGGTGHVRNHGVTATEWVLDSSEWVVSGSWLWEPDITTVTAEVARLDSLSNILLDDDSTTGSVNKPCTLLHLGDQLLVEETASLLVEWAVDGDNIALSQHLLQAVNTSAANLLLLLGAEWLVVEVEELLAVEWLESSENTLTNTTNGNGTDDLALKIVLTLGDGGNVPVTSLDLLVGGDEVADEDEDGHDDVLSNRDDVGASNLSDGETAVGLVGSIEIDVVRSNTSSNAKLEVLGLSKTLSSEVTWVEWGGDDDFGVYELLVELGVLTLLVGGGDEGVSLILKPFSDTELVLSCAQETWDLLGVLASVVQNSKNFDHFECDEL